MLRNVLKTEKFVSKHIIALYPKKRIPCETKHQSHFLHSPARLNDRLDSLEPFTNSSISIMILFW